MTHMETFFKVPKRLRSRTPTNFYGTWAPESSSIFENVTHNITVLEINSSVGALVMVNERHFS